MTEFIKGLIDVFVPRIAKLFDSLKLTNPAAALGIVSLLIGLQVFVEECTIGFCQSEWFDYVRYGFMVLLGLIGSRTSRYLPITADKKKDQLSTEMLD